jgi:hypothetical protein
MPSTWFRVTINGAAAPTTAPKDGFIDNKSIETYVGEGSAAPTTLVQTTAKERANIRFKFLQQQLQLEGNVYIQDIVATGGSSVAAPTSFVFTAVSERGDEMLFTRDETASGAPLTGIPALTRMIARALCEARTINAMVFDPTKTPTAGNSTPEARFGQRNVAVEVGAVASNLTTAAATVTITHL